MIEWLKNTLGINRYVIKRMDRYGKWDVVGYTQLSYSQAKQFLKLREEEMPWPDYAKCKMEKVG